MTFSIVAFCPRTGMLGVAVATAVPAVGAICPWVQADVGAVSTPSWVNPYLAIDALQLMACGRGASDALDHVIQGDAGRDARQVGVVDAQGHSAAWTGRDCTPWSGQIVEPNFAVQGNMLVSGSTLEQMARSFHDSVALDLTERLLLALEAADAAGGDKRGRQSAALLVHHREAYALCDLRVDEHARPIAELRRIHEIARLQLQPFVQGMPERDGRAEAAPAAVVALLSDPPPLRPGGGGSAP
jgi:uncharacterized Ntn-hydrolase superfamily protein